MFRILSAMSVLIFLLGCASIPLSKGDFVLIDETESAYIVYAGIGKDKIGEIREKLSNAPQEVHIVSLETFMQNSEKYIKAHIVKDEYPESRAVEGVVELIRKFPGTPFGITWNGGIAITHNDYQYAKRIYEQYKADPKSYELTRNRDLRVDPIHPKGHLGPLLGW